MRELVVRDHDVGYVVITQRGLSRVKNVTHGADVLSPRLQHITWLEVHLRGATHANTGWRSRENNVSRAKRDDRRELRDELRDRENEVSRGAVLHLYAVDRTSE